MKKTTISVSFEDEKLSALKMYLEQRGQMVEGELEKALDRLPTLFKIHLECGELLVLEGHADGCFLHSDHSLHFEIGR